MILPWLPWNVGEHGSFSSFYESQNTATFVDQIPRLHMKKDSWDGWPKVIVNVPITVEHPDDNHDYGVGTEGSKSLYGDLSRHDIKADAHFASANCALSRSGYTIPQHAPS